MLKVVTADTDIAEGYKPIAVRDDIAGNTVISYSTENRDFILAVSGKLMGPVTLKEIKALRENLNDVIELKGRYLFIKEFNVTGEST
jgi:hypothetical protein